MFQRTSISRLYGMTVDEYFGRWMKVIDRVELTKIMDWLKRVSPDSLCPSLSDIFKAFRLCPYDGCKVVMIGLDPYSDKYMGKPRATGILFGNRKDIPEDKLSPSLQIIKECAINFEIPHNFINFDNSLESWCRQGILMINSSLSCEAGKTGSHTLKWIPFMVKLLKNLSIERTGIVYVLFGKQAKSFKSCIAGQFNDIIEVEHPAYFARKGIKMPYEVFTVMNRIIERRYGEKITLFNEIT